VKICCLDQCLPRNQKKSIKLNKFKISIVHTDLEDIEHRDEEQLLVLGELKHTAAICQVVKSQILAKHKKQYYQTYNSL